MTKVTKQRLSIGAAVLIVMAGFAASGYIANQKEPPPKRSRVQALREVSVQEVSPHGVDISVPLQGRLVSFETVPLFAEVTGVFEESARPFKIGVYFKKGDVLARLDAEEARYALLAQKATLANSLAQAMPELKIDYTASFAAWDAYLRAFDPEKPLPELPPVADDATRFFLNARNIYSQYYQIKGAEERLSKYTLRAPVSGTLTAVNATPGALVRSGQPLGTLTAGTYELAATVPVADLTYLRAGTKAMLKGPNGRDYEATVSRISTQIDPNTQTATLYLNVRGDELREGLYLRGTAAGETLDNVVALDQGLLVGSDELYVVNDSTLRRERVEIVRRSGDQVFVRGLASGTPLLAEPLPGAFSGQKVSPRAAQGESNSIDGAAAGTPAASATPAG